MQLSTTEHEQLYAILQQYDENPQVQRMREFIQHGDVTTYQHCKNVVLVSFWLNRRFHLGADETSLAVGAFLHDFYLYDWHKRSSFRGLRRLFEMHGFAHPGSACVNAERCFAITRKEQNHLEPYVAPDLSPCPHLPGGGHRLPGRQILRRAGKHVPAHPGGRYERGGQRVVKALSDTKMSCCT